MKLTFFFFSLLIISCSSQETKEKLNDQPEVGSEKTSTQIEKVIKPEKTWEETQDSLRSLILNSKPNNNLKSNGVLQELYIRGLVNQKEDKIKFKLPFDLHAADCGAPDCYSTDITFEISAKTPIEFPNQVTFELLEYGCGIEGEISKDGIFKLVEQSPTYVNYYSEKQKSNLVILGEKRELYYFPDIQTNSIKVDLIDKIFFEYDEEEENPIVPYLSSTMIGSEYENFIEKE